MDQPKQTKRQRIKDSVNDAIEAKNAEARMKVLQMIMDEEGCTYEEAIDACLGENRIPRYSLYYKMGDLDVLNQLRTKKGKLAFAETLPEDEKEIFFTLMGEIHVNREMAKQVGKLPVDSVKKVRDTFRKNRELRRAMREQAKKMEDEE